MKVLVIGCGSIGRRHVNNLSNLKNVESISIYTKIQDCLNFLNNRNGKIKIIKNLKHVQADFAIICNETSQHLDIAISLAKKGINLFIEKPLSHNLKGTNQLRDMTVRKNIKLFVGYNLRFLGAINFIKKQLARNVIGDLFFARIEAGQYLPQWRKNIGYRQSYSADPKRGGGVALDLSHEVDYMRYLFGDPIKWKVLYVKAGNLGIDSEDIFEGLYLYGSNFICSTHMDYLQLEKNRGIRIVGSLGYLECDFVKKEIRIKKAKCNEVIVNDGKLFDIDDTYLIELKHFIAALRNNTEPAVNLNDGIWALRLIKENNVQK